MNFYHNFWALQDKRKELISLTADKVCIVCFNETCNCERVKIPKEKAFDILNFLMDVCIQESLNNKESFIHEAEPYDRDFIYPFFDNTDNTLVASIVRGEKHRTFADNQIYDGFFGDPNKEGVTWGYIEDDFIPVSHYNYPKWEIYEDSCI